MSTRTSPALFSLSAAAISSCGKPCVTGRPGWGADDQRQRAAPAHSHGERSNAARAGSSRPERRPSQQQHDEQLVVQATPVTAPAASHQRGCVAQARGTTSSAARATRKSTVAVSSRCPKSRGNARERESPGGQACARRPPPTSRAISAQEHDATATRQRGRHPHPPRLSPTSGRPRASKGRQRRLVDVAPGRFEHPEVQLVAVEAVAVTGVAVSTTACAAAANQGRPDAGRTLSARGPFPALPHRHRSPPSRPCPPPPRLSAGQTATARAASPRGDRLTAVARARTR